MGETTELILDGILCQVCGGAMDDLEELSDGAGNIHEDSIPGFPRTCEDCEKR